MVKEKRILSYFLGWLIVGFCIIFVGVNNVFAAEYYLNYDTYQRYYDNTGTLTEVNSSWNESLQSYISGNLTTVAGSTGAAWLVSSPIPMVKGHQYSISFAFVERNNIALSSKNKISVSNTVNGAVTNYNNSTYNAETIYSKVTSNTTLSFVFKANTNSSFIVIPFTTTSRVTQNYSVTMFVMEDLGTEGLSEEELNTTINNQTNTLNNSIQNSTDTITGEIDDMEQSIVDSNKETQEVIKDQFNSCRESYNLFNIKNYNGLIEFNGSNLPNNYIENNTIYLNNTNYLSFDGGFFLDIEPNKTYTITINVISLGTYDNKNNNARFRISDLNNNIIGRNDNINRTGEYSITVTPTTNKIFIGFNNIAQGGQVTITDTPLTINNIMVNEGSTAKPYEPYGEEVCSNKIDETNEQLGNINDALTDSSTPNLSGLENSIGWLPPGPVDSILNLPLTMLNSLTNSLTKTCSPLNLTLPYVNKNIQIPCLSAIFDNITGVNGLWSWVGTIASVLILYNYLLNLYAWVDRVLTLRAEFDEAMGADLANWGRL